MISIVTISLNQERFLRQCLRSVREESSRTPIEHICVDGGSTDGSVDTIRDSAPAQVLVGVDHGPADALNKGFAEAHGTIYGFINSDDFLLPGAGAFVEDYFTRNERTDVLLSSGVIVDEDGATVKRVRASEYTPRDYLFGAVTLFQQGMFFRASAFHRVGGFNPANTVSWDAELLLDLVTAGCRATTSTQETGAFRIYSGSITGSGRLIRRAATEHARMFERTVGRPPRAADRPERLARRCRKLVRERDRFVPWR